tara:strand:- start:1178 stop:1729 length:552 start_codon:yes stop_codon:yes gene_type:complete
MKLNIFLLVFFLFTPLLANQNEIINRLENTNNLKFKFSQSINDKLEKGECTVMYPKKIFCEYDDFYKKILVSNGKSLVINSDKNNQYYRYNIEKTPLNVILDKSFILKKISTSKNLIELKKSYSLEFEHNENYINVFFDKKNYNLLGWNTKDIYNNIVETITSDVKTNIHIDEEIFKIQNYIN